MVLFLLSSLCSSHLPVYADVQEPYVYLQNSHVEVSNLYLGVPTKATIRLINGTLLPTRFHWGKVSEPARSAPEARAEGDVAPQVLPGREALLSPVAPSVAQGLLLPSEAAALWSPSP